MHLPLRIPRKKPKPRKQIKNVLRTVFRVEAIGEGEYFGFQLDGDGRFLLGDFTVTHNSSLILQMCQGYTKQRYSVLYVAGEESLQQIKTRADRFGKFNHKMQMLEENDLDSIIAALDDEPPEICALDSINTITVEDYAPGSPTAIRIAAKEIYKFTQSHGIGLFLVVQMNKIGDDFAGPRELEHIMDTSLIMTVERDKTRMIKSIKNRFGDAPAQQRFEMRNEGLVEIDEPEQPEPKAKPPTEPPPPNLILVP